MFGTVQHSGFQTPFIRPMISTSIVYGIKFIIWPGQRFHWLGCIPGCFWEGTDSFNKLVRLCEIRILCSLLNFYLLHIQLFVVTSCGTISSSCIALLFSTLYVLVSERRSFGDSLTTGPGRGPKRFLQDFNGPLSQKLSKIPRHSTDGMLYLGFL